jgi:hypothetical protein
MPVNWRPVRKSLSWQKKLGGRPCELLPVWLRLRNALDTPNFNFRIVR